MKRIYLIMITALMLFGSVFLPGHTNAAVCQSKTAIVFSNGMFNDEEDALASISKLRGKVTAYPQASQYFEEFEFHLAYASNKDGLGTSILDQLLEIAYMWRNDQISSFMRMLGGLEVAAQPLQDAMTTLAGSLDAATYVTDVDFQKQLNGDGTSQGPGYRRLLNEGKRVVIVAHSQGNYYANAVYDRLTIEKPAWASSIGIVAVATPASRVADGRNRHITVPEDYIIRPVGSLPTNPEQGSSKNMAELTAAVWANATLGHNLIQWYLAGSFTRTIIINNILNTRLDLQPADYDMVPQVIMTGTQVAPASDGSFYITKVGGGVVHIDADGVETPVSGVPRIDYVDSADNLYYSDVALDPLTSATAASIYKMDSNGVVSTVYAGSNGASITSYDVAVDGTIYVLDEPPYDVRAYKVKAGQITKIAGAPAIRSGGFISQLQNGADFGMVANDAYFSFAPDSIYDVKDGYFYMADYRVNVYGGAYGYGVNSSGIIVPPPFDRLSYLGRSIDFCPNGDAVELSNGTASLHGGSGTFLGSGVPANVTSTALSPEGDDLYFVDSATSSVMKLVGRAN
jgi:hypothetical protein